MQPTVQQVQLPWINAPPLVDGAAPTPRAGGGHALTAVLPRRSAAGAVIPLPASGAEVGVHELRVREAGLAVAAVAAGAAAALAEEEDSGVN